jgi:hypothetical protein
MSNSSQYYSLYYPLKQNSVTEESHNQSANLWLVNNYEGLFELFYQVEKFGWEEIWIVTKTNNYQLPENRLIQSIEENGVLGTIECNKNIRTPSLKLIELSECTDWREFSVLVQKLRDVGQTKVKAEIDSLCTEILSSYTDKTLLKHPLGAESVLKLSAWKQLENACRLLETLRSQ